MDTKATVEIPVLPSDKVPSNGTQKSLAPKILVFAVTTLAVSMILRVAFSPKDNTKADNTVGRITRSQCAQIEGKITISPEGRDVCKFNNSILSLTD